VFDAILIANRGEIACRIARTARRMGVRTIAVYSDADRDALHVAACDEAYRIGPPPARDSYLDGAGIIAVAKRAGAQAVHPGYGFLSENAAFAQACADAGIVFIGPPPHAIAAMGSKSEAKRLMSAAGVPVVPGYHGDVQDDKRLRTEDEAIGYPVLIKAVSGGGGKGMRVVERAGDFAAALASARREAKSSFGDDRVLIERYLASPRHIELQVFADAHGHAVHLFERDCSVQRRHQKVIEEAPAPGMTREQRGSMGRAAVTAVHSIGYIGAGTIEFIVPHTFARDGVFYFMEMNTRLQVEHPVTEMITGTDLVEWQLRIAAGEPLPMTQDELAIDGHAIEVRLYAEDPARGFVPSVGPLVHVRMPEPHKGVRIDTGVREGDEISPHYDPMLAKLIVHAADRQDAVQKLAGALAECEVAGVATNIEFLRRVVLAPDYRRGELDTGFIARHEQSLLARDESASQRLLLAVALAEWHRLATSAQRETDPFSPWRRRDAWWLNSATHALRFDYRDGTAMHVVTMRARAPSHEAAVDWTVQVDDGPAAPAKPLRVDGERLVIAQEHSEFVATVVAWGEARHVFAAGHERRFERVDPLAHAGEQETPEGHLRAPMSGTIVAVMVKDGDRVARGASLIVLEAMKMEHTIVAPADGVVTAVRFRQGDRVQEGADLVELDIVAVATS